MLTRPRGPLALATLAIVFSAACGQDKVTSPKPTGLTCTPSGALALGQTVTGSLVSTTCRASDSTRVQTYTFTLAAPAAVDFAVHTDASYDPLLALYRDKWTDTSAVIALTDDDPADTSSYDPYMHTVLAAGTYVLAVMHYEPDFGAFTLTASTASGSAENCWDPFVQLPSLWVTPGTSSQQTLSTTDCSNTGGQLGDWVGLYLKKGQTVTINTTSLGTDTQLILYTLDGAQVATDDNGGGGINARLTYTSVAGGLYTLIVTAPAGVTGEYKLDLSSPSATAPATASAASANDPAIGSAWSRVLARRASSLVKSAR
jgi:hypothetical protein